MVIQITFGTTERVD